MNPFCLSEDFLPPAFPPSAGKQYAALALPCCCRGTHRNEGTARCRDRGEQRERGTPLEKWLNCTEAENYLIKAGKHLVSSVGWPEKVHSKPFPGLSSELAQRSAELPASPVKICGCCTNLTSAPEVAARFPCCISLYPCVVWGWWYLHFWKEWWGRIPNYFQWENHGSHFLRYSVESVSKADSSLVLFNPSVTPTIYLCFKKKVHHGSVCAQKGRLSLYITLLVSFWTSLLEVVQKIKLVLIRAAVY